MDIPGGHRPLALAVLVGIVVAAVAGVHLLPGSAGSPLNRVPADVDYVGHLDAEAMESDVAVANTTRAAFRFQSRVVFYDGPRFRESFAVGDSPLNRSRARAVTYFGRTNGSDYDARIVGANWTTSALVAAVESTHGVRLAATTRLGTTVFSDPNGSVAVAVLATDRYAVGNASAVRDVVAVVEGDAPSVDGRLRRALERQRPAYARFAYRFDPMTVPNLPFVWATVRRVRTVSAGYYVNHTALNRMGVRVNVTTASKSTARSIEGMLTLGTRYYDRTIEGANRSTVFDREMAKVSFDTVGTSTLIRYETTPEGMRELLAVLSGV